MFTGQRSNTLVLNVNYIPELKKKVFIVHMGKKERKKRKVGFIALYKGVCHTQPYSPITKCSLYSRWPCVLTYSVLICSL